jgi:Rha family phage regulatory protein
MNTLVLNYNGKAITTSRLIAEKFEKEHKNALQSIDRLECSKEFKGLNFQPLEHKELHPSPIIQTREYVISRDGFMFLVMGFTGERAAKLKEDFIKAFNEMEKLLRANITQISRRELAQMIIQLEDEKERQQVQIQQQQKEIKELAPKAEYTETVLQSTDAHTTTTIAKELGMSAQSLNDILHRKGVIYKQDGNWVLYWKYQSMGYTKTRTYTYSKADGTGTSIQTVWTEKGRLFIHSLLSLSRALNQAVPNNALIN